MRDVPMSEDLCLPFVKQLAARIVERKQKLFTRCRGSLDRAIAEAANEALGLNAERTDE